MLGGLLDLLVHGFLAGLLVGGALFIFLVFVLGGYLLAFRVFHRLMHRCWSARGCVWCVQPCGGCPWRGAGQRGVGN